MTGEQQPGEPFVKSLLCFKSVSPGRGSHSSTSGLLRDQTQHTVVTENQNAPCKGTESSDIVKPEAVSQRLVAASGVSTAVLIILEVGKGVLRLRDEMLSPKVTLILNTKVSVGRETLTQANVSWSCLGTVTGKQVRSDLQIPHLTLWSWPIF